MNKQQSFETLNMLLRQNRQLVRLNEWVGRIIGSPLNLNCKLHASIKEDV